MIGQHDAASANTNRLGAAGNVANDDRRGGACDTAHVVVLGKPEALVAPRLGVLRQVKGVVQGLRRCAALRNGRQIEQ